MRIFILSLFAVLTTSLYAGAQEKREILSSKIVLENSYGYFVLSDGSQWKTIPFITRWRSLSEWWNNAQLVPQNYQCMPKDWFLGTEIQVYSKYENLTVSEADASNEDALKQCTHLLVNGNTGQILFAIALHPAESLLYVFEDARKEGYEQGFYEGRFVSPSSVTRSIGSESKFDDLALQIDQTTTFFAFKI
jgi:hypothetical protein